MSPRYRFLALWVACLALFAASLAAAADAAEATWKVGLAKTQITPEKYMWMAGYGSRDRPADGKLTDLWAKAMVLQDASGERALLVTMDLIGVSRELAGGGILPALARHEDETLEHHAGRIGADGLGEAIADHGSM